MAMTEVEKTVKIGVLSDIHSNIIALRECVNYMEKEGCQEYLLLGDYVSDTPYTRAALDYLYDFMATHKCTVLRGNREEYMLRQRTVRENDLKGEKWLWNSASGNLLFTYEQLQERDFAFFENLPITFKYEKEGYPAITCCHGSPDSSRELLQFYGENTYRWLEKIDTDYMICAHTHFPGELHRNGKHYFNAGSIGIAIGDYGFAQCMILEAVEKYREKDMGKTEEKTGETGSLKMEEAGGTNRGKTEKKTGEVGSLEMEPDVGTDIGKTGEFPKEIIWKPTFLKIPYDSKQVVEDIKKSGLLDKAGWFMNCNIKILLTGVDVCARLVELAGKLSVEAGEQTRWPLIDEKYFAQAAAQLGVQDYREQK